MNISFVILFLLVAAFVLLILGFFLPQRIYLWVAAIGLAMVAVLLKVFGGGV